MIGAPVNLFGFLKSVIESDASARRTMRRLREGYESPTTPEGAPSNQLPVASMTEISSRDISPFGRTVEERVVRFTLLTDRNHSERARLAANDLVRLFHEREWPESGHRIYTNRVGTGGPSWSSVHGAYHATVDIRCVICQED